MFKKVNFDLLFFLKLLFVPILYELVIGGGGRYLELGPLSFRMVLFGIALAVSFIYFLNKKVVKKDIIVLVVFFTILTTFSSIVGYFNYAPVEFILGDLKPLFFFYIILFFSLVIKKIEDIDRIGSIIKKGSIILAVIYIIVILLLLYGIIDFSSFYEKQNDIGEIMFRNDSLFIYKGFLYLCIGFFFFLFSNKWYSKWMLFFLFFSIVLTLTRGFILFTTLIGIYYVFFINKNVLLKICTSLVMVMVLVGLSFLMESLGDKSGSDSARFVQIDQVLSNVNPISFFIGHGFGIGVPIRPRGMELSLLEIFHKQGLLGLSFWFGMFIYIFLMYTNIKNKEYKKKALPFLLSVIFIILQSGTNPYMNNPIGLSMILITLVVFSRLLELQKQL
ncbi:hypothetical protein [Flavobacterium sp. ov086]|uniref:hypothetical protein n=1 Tax=Flavobacterium sp. ov086 TaxID=1761785 RepID=UPI000B6B8BD6|nr:hypothetical protein [Flavobacterium sp. ov086]SNR49460.1 hypothetical protein SAMN04487979_10863 [Flavobacterium sp. ov086]